MSTAVVELRYRRIRVLPPTDKQRRYPSLDLTVLYATERGTPKGRQPINWKIVTDLAINSRTEAVETLRWYALRWRIETFHKILKSGCRAEDLKLRTSERIVHVLAIFCLLSWRIFWLTMLQRATSRAASRLVFIELELKLLVRVSQRNTRRNRGPQSALLQLACLGGYLNRASDGPPGNSVVWRGIARLTDITLGYELAHETCG